MKFSNLFFVTFLSLLITSVTTSNFKKCFSKDLSCLKDAIQDALPKLKDGIDGLGVPALDPLLVPKMTLRSGNIVNLIQNHENVLWYGLSRGIIRNVSFDMDEGKLVLDVTGSAVDMNSSYTAKGKVMILDINGRGKSWIRLERLEGKLKLDLEKYTIKSIEFFRATNIILELQVEHGRYHFENVFDGNKLLSDNINQVINDNWRVLYDEQVPLFLKSIGASLLILINKLFSKMPIQTMFLD